MSNTLRTIIFQNYPLLITLLTCLNATSFAFFGIDKSHAIHKKRRIPENILLGLAILGGALGGVLGMQFFRHKTSRLQFSIGIPLLLFFQGIFFALFIIIVLF